MECEYHPTQNPKYYCSDPNCKVLLCGTCLKCHTMEHASAISTIENVKLQTFRTLRENALSQFETVLGNIFKSTQMNNLFKDGLSALMQKDSREDWNEDDITDILADDLRSRYFPEGIKVEEPPMKDLRIEFAQENLISFDYEYDAANSMASEEEGEKHEKTAKNLCNGESELYSREPLKIFNIKSKAGIVFWESEHKSLLYCQQDESIPYELPESETLSLLTVLNSTELLFLGALEGSLIVYSIAEKDDDKDRRVLKKLEEFKHDKIVFLESDNVDRIFVVTDPLIASTYTLKKQDDKVELCSLASFEVSGVPKKVLFDTRNSLLFIAYEKSLEVYKNGLIASPRLIQRFTKKEFSWHQKEKKLLLLNSNELYQFDKGKFRLIKKIDKEVNCLELTKDGIIGHIEKKGLCLISQKNSKDRKLLTLPCFKSIMEELHGKSYERLFSYGIDSEIDPSIGEFSTSCESIKLLKESPSTLLLFVDIHSYQSASQRAFKYREPSWREYGGSIYHQSLIKYEINQNMEIEEEESKGSENEENEESENEEDDDSEASNE